jgi:hypothetical protein
MEKKQSKLYTEEQLRDAIAFGNINRPSISNDYWIERQTPIELPTDEEIYELAEKILAVDYLSFTEGAKWMRDKIKGGNNE